MSIQSIISLFDKKTYLQLGRASVNLPDLCLKWGDFNFAGSNAWKAEVPPTWNFEGVHGGGGGEFTLARPSCI